MTPCCVEDLRGKHVVSLACGSKHTIALTGECVTFDEAELSRGCL